MSLALRRKDLNCVGVSGTFLFKRALAQSTSAMIRSFFADRITACCAFEVSLPSALMARAFLFTR